MNTHILALAIIFSIFFINHKISNAVKVIAFKENESEMSAKISFITMIIIMALWSFYVTH